MSPSRRALIATLLSAALGCVRSERGAECGSNLDCGAGRYCDYGQCKSDCASATDCPRGHLCSWAGQCLRADRPICDEGPVAAPPDVVAAMPGRDDLLLAEHFFGPEDCDRFRSVNDAPWDVVVSACWRLWRATYLGWSFVSAPRDIAECRPAEVADGRARWHALPGVLLVALNSSLEARWTGSTVALSLGHVASEGNAPDPATIWLRGEGQRGGARTTLITDGRVLEQAYAAVYGPTDPENPGGPFQFTATREVRPGGGVQLDERLDSLDEDVYSSFRLRAISGGGRLIVEYRDFNRDRPALAVQMRQADHSGRLDDEIAGYPRTLCWDRAFVDDGTTSQKVERIFMTYWSIAGYAYGNPSLCAYGPPEPLL